MKRGRWRGRPPPWAEFAAASRPRVRAVTQDCSARSSDRRGSAGSVVPPLAPPTGGGHCPTRRHVGADEAPLPRAAGSLPTPARPRESGVPLNCETPGSRRGAGTGLVGSSASSAPSPASPGSGGHRPCHCRKRVAGGRTCHWVDPAAEGRSADEEPNPAPRKRDASAEQCGRPGPQHWGATPLPLTVPPPRPAGTASRSCPRGQPFVET